MKHRNTLIFAGAVLLLPLILRGQETTLHYVSTWEEIANPERGWCDFYATHSGGASLGSVYRPLNARELINLRQTDHITLVWRIFYLHQFLEEDSVSQEYLDLMQADFDSLRTAGVKCIIRFSYSASLNAETWDATPDRVFSQIQSLAGVLADNSDVIAVVQAGFVGVWGEWYYTKNFAGQGYVPDETDQQNRRLLVEKLLGILPENIVVECRTPAIMKNITGTGDPISPDEAFDGTVKSRTGHHNDCFLASVSDYGTYTHLEEDLDYLHATTTYTITGGETCDASNQYSDCVNGVPRMELLHWTYLNRDYNKEVYQKWIDQGCYGEINLRLGYRIRLDSASLPDSAGRGEEIPVRFAFRNTGFAAPTQFRPVTIVLTHSTTRQRTFLTCSGPDSDIRYWLPGEILLEGSIRIPDTLSDGNYTMDLCFPDKDPGLSADPAYSIRLANAGMWNEQYGTNRLDHMIVVGKGGTGSLPAGPSGLSGSAQSKTEILLSWNDESDNETGFEIIRATGDRPVWEQVFVTGPDAESYLDDGLYGGKYYQYRVRAVNEVGNAPFSDSVSVHTLGLSARPASRLRPEIFPNPLTGDELVIRCEGKGAKTVQILDESGRCIFEDAMPGNELRISRSSLPTGSSLVLIRTSEGTSASVLVGL